MAIILNSTAYIAGSLLIFVGTISILCSILTLRLIYVMGRWNGFLLLITSMTICQLIYDSIIILIPLSILYDIYDWVTFISTFGGLASTLWTNVIACVVLYIVFYHTTVDIFNRYSYYFLIVLIPSTALATNDMIEYDNHITPEFRYYFWLRLLSIAFNIFAYSATSYKVYSMGLSELEAVSMVVTRLKYYPLVQILARAAPTYYEALYEVNYIDNNFSTSQKIALYLYSLSIPAAGIGFFIVFLIVEPHSYTFLKSNWASTVFPWYIKGGFERSPAISIEREGYTPTSTPTTTVQKQQQSKDLKISQVGTEILICTETMIKSCPVCLDDFYFTTENIEDGNVNKLVISSSYNSIGSNMSAYLEPPRNSISYTSKSALTENILHEEVIRNDHSRDTINSDMGRSSRINSTSTTNSFSSFNIFKKEIEKSKDRRKAIELRCGHIFCKNCLETFLNTRYGRLVASCPICRHTITIRNSLINNDIS